MVHTPFSMPTSTQTSHTLLGLPVSFILTPRYRPWVSAVVGTAAKDPREAEEGTRNLQAIAKNTQSPCSLDRFGGHGFKWPCVGPYCIWHQLVLLTSPRSPTPRNLVLSLSKPKILLLRHGRSWFYLTHLLYLHIRQGVKPHIRATL